MIHFNGNGSCSRFFDFPQCRTENRFPLFLTLLQGKPPSRGKPPQRVAGLTTAKTSPSYPHAAARIWRSAPDDEVAGTQAAAETLVGTEAMVVRICEAIW